MNNPENRLDEIASVSKAAAGLLGWVKASVNLYEVHKKVEPLKNKLDAMTKKLAQLNEELKETNALIDRLNKDLGDLEENRSKKQARLDDLTEQATKMEKKLNAAKKLISGLGREQVRWTEDS